MERNIRRHAEATKDKISGEKDDTANMGRLGRDNALFLTRPILAPLKYVMELAGLDMRDWSMNFSAMPHLALNFGNFLLYNPTILEVMEELEQKANTNPGILCPQLAERSLQALESVHHR